MLRKDLVFKFCSPAISSGLETTKEFSVALMESMRKSGSIDFAGYMEDEDLQNDLQLRLGKFHQGLYRRFSAVDKKKVKSAVELSLQKCSKLLKHPEPPIYVFVFPWFPSKGESKLFGGVNAVAPHSNVLHLFIDINHYTSKSLKETAAHEYNHLIFYKTNPAEDYTLLENILIEGLAENFREDAVGGKPAPWATTLTVHESENWLSRIKSKLDTKDKKMIDQILFGTGEYPRWLGYSLGYHLVKKYRNLHNKKTWPELESTKPKEFLKL